MKRFIFALALNLMLKFFGITFYNYAFTSLVKKSTNNMHAMELVNDVRFFDGHER